MMIPCSSLVIVSVQLHTYAFTRSIQVPPFSHVRIVHTHRSRHTTRHRHLLEEWKLHLRNRASVHIHPNRHLNQSRYRNRQVVPVIMCECVSSMRERELNFTHVPLFHEDSKSPKICYSTILLHTRKYTNRKSKQICSVLPFLHHRNNTSNQLKNQQCRSNRRTSRVRNMTIRSNS